MPPTLDEALFIASGDWNKRVSCVSTNYRDMIAILLAIIPFRRILKSKSVQIMSDNITSIAYVNHKVGSCQILSQITTSIWAEVVNNRMPFQCSHIAYRKNLAADHWSLNQTSTTGCFTTNSFRT